MSVNGCAYLFKVTLAKELLERAVRLPCPANVGKSLCTDTLCVLNELVYLLAGICCGAVLYMMSCISKPKRVSGLSEP